jgi:hypothetical protein
MSRKSIRVDVLKRVVADASQQFATKDISEDKRMRAAHPELVSHSHYHAFVGGALSDHHVQLNIVEVRKDTSRGSRWQKQGLAKLAELNDRAVKHLVDAHSRLDEPLLLAIRYKLDEPDIHLLEVLDGFPGEDTDEPLETEFGPSPGVRMIATLKLALVNPQQFRALAKGSSAILEAIKTDGRVEFYVGEGKELAELLGLASPQPAPPPFRR